VFEESTGGLIVVADFRAMLEIFSPLSFNLFKPVARRKSSFNFQIVEEASMVKISGSH
jgi:hypothetical protein